MKRSVQLTLTLIVTVLSLAPLITAEVPELINYQGRLTDSTGQPLDTTLAMTFTIYVDSVGGIARWTETQADVSTSDGLFNVQLGSINSITATVFDGAQRWLEIVVDSQPVGPRTQLTTVPYSFRSSTVDGAAGGTIRGDVDIEGDLTARGYTINSRDIRVQPTTRYYWVPPAAFQASDCFEIQDNVLVHRGTAGCWARAPLHLPHGAKITRVVLYYSEVGRSGYFVVSRSGAQPAREMLICDTAVGNQFDSLVVTNIAHSTIDNAQYGYQVALWLEGGARLHSGVRFEYVIESLLP